MIADFQNKATGHWISIFKESAKSLQQTNDVLWFRLPRSQIPCSPYSIIRVAARQQSFVGL
jgi:hypothetical protein